MLMETELLLGITGVAALMDLKEKRVLNEWMMFSYAAGMGYRIFTDGLTGIAAFLKGMFIPFMLLWFFYCCRMIGSADVKMFCLIGGIIGPFKGLNFMLCTFLIGGILSLGIVAACGNLAPRIRHLLWYIKNGRGKPYIYDKEACGVIHLMVPIFFSVMLYTGGVY